MKKTLLEITQIILSKMDSDEVNSIGDTTESLQVAQEVETTYYEMLGNLTIPERNTLIQFEAVIDPDNKPNYLKVQELVDNFSFLMYNIGTEEAPDYKKLTYLAPKDFILYVTQNSGATASVVVTDPSGVKYPVKNDAHPTYYTMFDDQYVATDSYLATVDDTLQESKALAVAQVIPTFRQEDDFIPELPAKLFPMLIAESASMCFINHKQSANSKEEQRARRQLARHTNNRNRTKEADTQGPDYGRKR